MTSLNQEPESDKAMSFWEHLDELRTRLVRACLAYVAAVFVAWHFKDLILKWLMKPFIASWYTNKVPGEPALNFAAPSDIFSAYLKLALVAGLLIAAPVIFFQIWAFIAPGLYKKEKRWATAFVVGSTVFFVGGALFGWRVGFPISFNYFLGLTGEAQHSGVVLHPTVMMGEYLDFVTQMMLVFGIIFELPLFITLLSTIGLVNYLSLIRFGRWFVMIASVVGAVFSPPDTVSMIVMTVPIIALYFLSIGLAYLFGKRPSPDQLERDRRWREEKKLDTVRRAVERKRAKAAEKAAEKAAAGDE